MAEAEEASQNQQPPASLVATEKEEEVSALTETVTPSLKSSSSLSIMATSLQEEAPPTTAALAPQTPPPAAVTTTTTVIIDEGKATSSSPAASESSSSATSSSSPAHINVSTPTTTTTTKKRERSKEEQISICNVCHKEFKARRSMVRHFKKFHTGERIAAAPKLQRVHKRNELGRFSTKSGEGFSTSATHDGFAALQAQIAERPSSFAPILESNSQEIFKLARLSQLCENLLGEVQTRSAAEVMAQQKESQYMEALHFQQQQQLQMQQQQDFYQAQAQAQAMQSYAIPITHAPVAQQMTPQMYQQMYPQAMPTQYIQNGQFVQYYNFLPMY